MNKKSKFLIILIIINLIATLIISLYQNVTYAATSQTTSKVITSSNINSIIDDSKYPGIKSMIQTLQKEHPNWNFKVFYTGLDWNTVIKGESTPGRNVIGAGRPDYSGDWICSTCNASGKTYEGGDWVCVSSAAIKYMMDPRNSLNDRDIFQFLELSYDKSFSYNSSVVTEILEGTFLNDGNLESYVDTIMSASKTYSVNPYYIAVKIIQEQGTDGGNTWRQKSSGTYYYNIFNIKATGSTKSAIKENALAYAISNGLTTVEACLEDGVSFISGNYISVGQDTMYFEKFDVIAQGGYYAHQYATDVMYAQNQGTALKKVLEKINAEYTFVIPLYENMPSTACARPATTSTSSVTIKNNMRIDSTNKLITTIPDTKISNVLSTLGDTSLTVKNASGTKITTTSNVVGTGYKVGNYTVIVMGDVNGDATVNTIDAALVLKAAAGKYTLKGNYLTAAKVSSSSSLTTVDAAIVLKMAAGKYTITIK